MATPTQLTAAAATIAGLTTPTTDTAHIIAVAEGLSPKAARSALLYAVMVLRSETTPQDVLTAAQSIAAEVKAVETNTIEEATAA